MDALYLPLPQDQRDAWRDVLNGEPTQFALTLTYNIPDISPDRIRHDIRGFHARLDRHLLGPRFYKKASLKRTRLWGVIEMTTHYPVGDEKRKRRVMGLYYPHIHLGIQLPDGFDESHLLDAKKIWLHFAPHGDYDLRAYYEGWAGYATKALPDTSFVLMSREFLPG